MPTLGLRSDDVSLLGHEQQKGEGQVLVGLALGGQVGGGEDAFI